MKLRFERLLDFAHAEIQSSTLKPFMDLTELGRMLYQEKNEHFLFHFMKSYRNSNRFNKFMIKLFLPEGLGFIAFKQLRLVTACLDEENIFTEENFNLLLSCDYPEQMLSQFKALNFLNIFGILESDNRELLKFKRNPEEFAKILVELHQENILTREIKEVLKNHHAPRQFSQNLIILSQSGLLNMQNIQLLQVHPYQQTIKNALLALKNAQILDQIHLNSLFDPNHHLLLIHRASETIWGRIPEARLARHWNQLLHSAREQLTYNRTHRLELDTTIQLEIFVDHILLGNAPPPQSIQPINNAQSTHTASVHQSVSQSAIKLYQRYAHLIQGPELEHYIQKIRDLILALPNQPIENKAAKNCINRITAPNYVFVDATSDVSIRQLLALSFIAIHDELNRQASLEDAIKQFILGLYEIQRGYNQDDIEDDSPICTAGTFNKLIEKLQSIHPDCQIHFISKELAALKLPKVVTSVLKNYLATHSLQTQAYENLKENGIEVLWHDLEPMIIESMFNEFGSLYHHREHPEFKALIANGIWIDISEILEKTNSVQTFGMFSNHAKQAENTIEQIPRP
jgi:hypothetical protein